MSIGTKVQSIFSGTKDVQAIHQRLLKGETLTYSVAKELEKADGSRFSKNELAANMAIYKDLVDTKKVKADPLGQDAFFDILKKKTQSRWSALAQGAQAGATLGAKIGGAVTGVPVGIMAFAAGLSIGGPGAAAVAGGSAAVTAAIPGAVKGAAIGGLAQGAWFAVRN